MWRYRVVAAAAAALGVGDLPPRRIVMHISGVPKAIETSAALLTLRSNNLLPSLRPSSLQVIG
jgi:hypothetical protein